MRNRKEELLDGLIEYLVRHGPSDLSLRPMAAEIGTSARLLIFHFQSKEQLLVEVLDEMQARLQGSLARLQAAKPGPRRAPLLRMFWDWATSETNFGHLCLHYQLHILAVQSRGIYAQYLERNSENWLRAIQAALPAEKQDPAFATLLGAVFDGLFIELMSTGDKKRTTKALDEFIQLATQQTKTVKPSRRRS
ncbi:MAG TPA: TetR/AcrR family transcriptional regulator [Holophagaceae bacterium]|jgi:AcrR family transcriptional regulator|nr:TetR/AcrR family transcriptional regulator [Holophagaceae bacterium]